jgi:predicted phage terminase large subunit-like protein
MPLVERERLLGGNWKIRPAAGLIFNRAWFEIVSTVPPGGIDCLFWDFASKKKELAKDDPDYTAAVKIRFVQGGYYVLDCFCDRMGPADAFKTFRALTYQHYELSQQSKSRFMVRWELEPGAMSRYTNLTLLQLIAGLDGKGIDPQGDKLLRARGLASQAEGGNVKVLKAPWNDAWLAHMHSQPADHDDIMDASSGSFNCIALPKAGPAAVGGSRPQLVQAGAVGGMPVLGQMPRY